MLNLSNQYKVIIISGPSGSGKTTIAKKLVQEIASFKFITTHTTRNPREGETDGIDYHFVSKEEFLKLKTENYFVENAEVFGNFYGVSFKEIENTLLSQKNILLEIDWQGAKRVKEVYGEKCFSVFIQTHNLYELEKRLILRGKDSQEVVKKRIKQANYEISKAYQYDMHLINDQLEQTFEKIKNRVIEFINS